MKHRASTKKLQNCKNHRDFDFEKKLNRNFRHNTPRNFTRNRNGVRKTGSILLDGTKFTTLLTLCSKKRSIYSFFFKKKYRRMVPQKL